MKLTLPLLVLPVALLACETDTTTPPGTARALTPAEVTTVTTRARAELAPAFTDALQALDTSTLLRDADLDIDGLPSGAELAQEIQPITDAIFAASSIESRAETAITYLVPAQAVCDGDEGCIRALTTHPVRFTASSIAVDQLNLAIDVGARRVRALDVEITADRVTVESDLAQLRALVVELAPDLDLDVARLPTAAGGRVHLELGEHDLVWSTTGNAHVEGNIDGAAYRLALGDSNVTLDVDAAQRTIVGQVHLGAIAADFPFAWIGSTTVCSEPDVCETREAQGQIQYAIRGVDARVHIDTANDMVVLDDLGFGGAPAAVSLDGVRQVSFDLNAAQGHNVDLSVHYLRQELEVAVSPSLEAVLELTMEQIAAQVDVAAWAVRDNLRLRFDGASSPTMRFNFDDESVRVVAGTLSVVSDSSTFTAMADQCVGAREDVPADAGIVEALMSYPCE